LAFQSGREADHSPPYSGRDQRMVGAVLLIPQYAFMAWCSGGEQGQLHLHHLSHYTKCLDLVVSLQICRVRILALNTLTQLFSGFLTSSRILRELNFIIGHPLRYIIYNYRIFRLCVTCAVEKTS
jgi:hypothetical protein